eukprot:1953825-Rhodomonas_salina.2
MPYPIALRGRIDCRNRAHVSHNPVATTAETVHTSLVTLWHTLSQYGTAHYYSTIRDLMYGERERERGRGRRVGGSGRGGCEEREEGRREREREMEKGRGGVGVGVRGRKGEGEEE